MSKRKKRGSLFSSSSSQQHNLNAELPKRTRLSLSTPKSSVAKRELSSLFTEDDREDDATSTKNFKPKRLSLPLDELIITAPSKKSKCRDLPSPAYVNPYVESESDALNSSSSVAPSEEGGAALTTPRLSQTSASTPRTPRGVSTPRTNRQNSAGAMSSFFNPSTPAKKWDDDSPLLSMGCAHRPKLDTGLTTESLTRYEQDFEETKVIAKGSFGVVTKCKKRVDGCFYAVKRTIKRFRGGMAKNQALKEVFALAALPAIPNIVRYFSAWVEDGFAYIQMELCDASLKQLMLDSNVRWDEEKFRTLLKQVATGIKHLHDRNLCHMDIKPENIFVKNGIFKIGDMGLVTVIKGSPREIDEGDCRYLPREVLQNDDELDLRKADVFSLGCSMYAVITSEELPPNGALWHEIRNGKLRYLPQGQKLVSAKLAAIIRNMMAPKAVDRPTIDQLLASKLLGSDIEKRIRRQDGKIHELQKVIRQLQGRKMATSSNPMAKPPVLRRTSTL